MTSLLLMKSLVGNDSDINTMVCGLMFSNRKHLHDLVPEHSHIAASARRLFPSLQKPVLCRKMTVKRR